MKKSLLVVMIMVSLQMFSQEAYKGKGDQKVGIGLSIATQGGGTGLNATYDLGLGENIKPGFNKSKEFEIPAGAYINTVNDRSAAQQAGLRKRDTGQI